MSTLATTRTHIAKRRSSRIALNTSIVLSGQDRHKCSFTMPATATNLNRHGASIQLPRELLVGSTLTVRNARGTQVAARVVSQLAGSQGVSVYAIEFVEQNDAANKLLGNYFSADCQSSRFCRASGHGAAPAERLASSELVSAVEVVRRNQPCLLQNRHFLVLTLAAERRGLNLSSFGLGGLP